MGYKKIIIISLLITLIIPISTGDDVSDHPFIRWEKPEVELRWGWEQFDPSVDDWDNVEDWEIEYCKKWGGSVDAGVNHGSTSKVPIALSELTISLQGEKTEYNIANQSDLYKASWYIEPTSGELDFKVFFIGDGKLEIKRGIASNTKAGFGYYTSYINKSYTHVKIEYPGNYLQVPIVS